MNKTCKATHTVGTTYIEEADVDMEVNVHVINSSIFSTETQATIRKAH